MARIPTVKIKDDAFDRGFRTINEADYDEDEHDLYDSSPEEEADRVDATDEAKALAKEEEIDLSSVEGSGKNGRILKSDVSTFVDED